MIAWTTQGFEITVEGVDLSDANVSVDVAQFNKSGSIRASVSLDGTVTYDGTDSVVTAAMSQAQSGLFTNGLYYVQINAVWSGNIRRASDWIPRTAFDNLRPEEVDYA